MKLFSRLMILSSLVLSALSARAEVPDSLDLDAYNHTSTIVRIARTALSNRHEGDWIDLRRNGQPDCGLSHVQMRVSGDGAFIDYLQVVFGNNESQRLHVRERFARGASSRWIDLHGNRRCIRGIYVVGQSDSRRPRASILDFYGLRSVNHSSQVLLGETYISNRPDGDTIDLRRDGRPDCGLTKFKFQVLGDATRVSFLGLRFGNGEFVRLPASQIYRPGEQSRWFDLPGNRRCVTHIHIFAESSDRRPRQSRVRFIGLRN